MPADVSRVESAWMSGWPEENTEPRPCTQTRAVRRRPRGSATTPSSQTPSRVRSRTSVVGIPAGAGMAGRWPDSRRPSRGTGVPYTPSVIISQAVADNLAKASWIRRMFEEGARLKQERGADKIFDFTLGNPEIEPPPAVLAAARRVLDNPAPHLHAYMPNAGHPRVREAVARRVSAATGLPYTANHVLMTVGVGAAL